MTFSPGHSNTSRTRQVSLLSAIFFGIFSLAYFLIMTLNEKDSERRSPTINLENEVFVPLTYIAESTTVSGDQINIPRMATREPSQLTDIEAAIGTGKSLPPISSSGEAKVGNPTFLKTTETKPIVCEIEGINPDEFTISNGLLVRAKKKANQ